MSMSTPGPERVPSTVRVDKKSGQGKPPAGKPAAAKSGKSAPARSSKTAPAKSGGARPGSRPVGKGPAGKGRKPIKPVTAGRNWGPIAVVAVVVLIAAGIIGYGVYASIKGSETWQEKAADIKGIVNYRAQ